MATAEVNGVELYYEIHGSGEPLFLTHGSWGDATAWQGVVPGLAERFEVVVWDRRGHSRSSDGAGPGSLQEDADDLATLIEHLDRAGAHLYGTSSGGVVVLNLVASRLDLVADAAVHEPAVPALLDGSADAEITHLLSEMRSELNEVSRLIEAGDGRKAAEYFIDNVALGPGSWDRLPEEVQATFAANAPTYGDELADQAGWTVDTSALSAGDVPIMITLGTESPPLLLATTRELIRQIPSAHVETLEGAGHVPYRTHPDLWIATVSRFFETATDASI